MVYFNIFSGQQVTCPTAVSQKKSLPVDYLPFGSETFT